MRSRNDYGGVLDEFDVEQKVASAQLRSGVVVWIFRRSSGAVLNLRWVFEGELSTRSLMCREVDKRLSLLGTEH